MGTLPPAKVPSLTRNSEQSLIRTYLPPPFHGQIINLWRNVHTMAKVEKRPKVPPLSPIQKCDVTRFSGTLKNFPLTVSRLPTEKQNFHCFHSVQRYYTRSVLLIIHDIKWKIELASYIYIWSEKIPLLYFRLAQPKQFWQKMTGHHSLQLLEILTV